jgi:hypothetical protein
MQVGAYPKLTLYNYTFMTPTGVIGTYINFLGSSK